MKIKNKKKIPPSPEQATKGETPSEEEVGMYKQNNKQTNNNRNRHKRGWGWTEQMYRNAPGKAVFTQSAESGKRTKDNSRYRQNRRTAQSTTHAIGGTGRNAQGVESTVGFLVQDFLQSLTAGLGRTDVLRRRLAILSQQPLCLQSRRAARGVIFHRVTSGLWAPQAWEGEVAAAQSGKSDVALSNGKWQLSLPVCQVT